MGLTPKRLLEYFYAEELKFLLSIINEPQTGTRPELTERILIEWPTHNKKWHNFLNYLDKPRLSQICKDYNLDHKGTRDTLVRRLKKELGGKPIKKISSIQQTNYHKEDATKNINLFLGAIISILLVIGLTMGLLAWFGYFNPTFEQPIPISKDYVAMYPISINDNKTKSEGGVGEISIKGEVILKSTLFSANNPIDVLVEFNSDSTPDPNFEHFIKILPENYWAFFLDASNIVDGQIINKNLAIINLTRTDEPPRISGNGTIIYANGGVHEIYVIDPRELENISDLINNRLDQVSFTYRIPENQNSTVLMNDDGSVEIQPAIFSKLMSETKSYFVEIKSADAMTDLQNGNNTGFALWMTIFGIPSGILLGFHNQITRTIVNRSRN